MPPRSSQGDDEPLALVPLEVSDLSHAQRALRRAILDGPRDAVRLTDDEGRLRQPFDLMLRAPEVGGPLQALGAAIRYSGRLPDDLRELAILTCAVEIECAHEWAAHHPLAVAAGIAPDVLARLVRGGDPERPDQRAIVSAVRALSKRRRLPAADHDRLAAHLDQAEILELMVLVGYYATLGTLLNTFTVV